MNTESNKVFRKATIFVPISTCACNYREFQNNALSLLAKYQDKINYDIRDLMSQDAYKHNIMDNTILIEEFQDEERTILISDRRKITSIYELQDYLEKL